MFTKTRKSWGRWGLLVAYTHEGVGGVVPNHAPHVRTIMLSLSKTGPHLHLRMSTLHTWNGYRNAEFEVSYHPSKATQQRRNDEHAATQERAR